MPGIFFFTFPDCLFAFKIVLLQIGHTIQYSCAGPCLPAWGWPGVACIPVQEVLWRHTGCRDRVAVSQYDICVGAGAGPQMQTAVVWGQTPAWIVILGNGGCVHIDINRTFAQGCTQHLCVPMRVNVALHRLWYWTPHVNKASEKKCKYIGLIYTALKLVNYE